MVNEDTISTNIRILVFKWCFKINNIGRCIGHLMSKVFTYIPEGYYTENYPPFVNYVSLCLILLLCLKINTNE